ncbi:Putative enoyl-CoA hydratase/isomerase, ClpP/crotonase-like domain superfamily [Septoria linicola]|uniref:Enoyl-CoA hydratase/isomerase, ClpP/crotonase-like domain superfamily n=1 Tax=Septoria linicola TaxID=215465 RepID=A0A9Q9EMD3_9PEZI|nr:putative enoyl-CoA hydratase/isomerase, ClpP/crotonase-like domain superfamily [Septoria linicola]USW55412.1 Putative enoyl-CoA hydratase/isomerase, ClpP/crotonase-like domain superfamily [Septoria linicola]
MSSPNQAEQNAVQVTYPSQGITLITISRPHRRNAVNAATAQLLYEAITTFEDDPLQKIAILTGANDTFVAGFDLHTVEASSSNIHYPLDSVHRTIGPMGPSRLQVKKPLLCAVSGYAVAGGLELSLLGDMRIVDEDAIFGVFCRRWGVPLIDGGTVRLQRIVGLGRALDMILTGRPVDAKEALSMGLANRVVPKGKALDETVKLAKQLLEFPQLCMNLDRASCYNAAYDAESFTAAMQYEIDRGMQAVAAEGAAGAKRFSKEKVGRGGVFPGKL